MEGGIEGEEEETTGNKSNKSSVVPLDVASIPPLSKEALQQKLLAKRAEVLATQLKLQSLDLEQQQLEMLYISSQR